MVTFPSQFDISGITSIKSVLLGTGTSYEGLGWTENKIKSDTPLGNEMYDHTYEVSGQNIMIYSMSNNMDPRSGIVDDLYAIF